jgi:hypothetical protein
MLPQSTLELIDSLSDHCDVVDWINQTLGAQIADETSSNPQQSVDLVELDQRVTHLVATLEVACEDTSSQLEHIIDDVSRGVPRLAHDVHSMRDSAVSLQNTLLKIHDRSKESTPHEMVLWLDKLQTLDTTKQRMEAARDVLREAESWSTLELEVTSLLAEQSYSKAAERLSEASRSMVVFQNTPEFESRRTLMVSLQNQLEASLSSALVAAINSQDLVVCRNYFFIFSVIQRESEFRNYYNGSRRASLVAMWQNANLLDCTSTPSSPSDSLPQTLSDFLPRFYTSFLSLLNSERTSIIAIFPDPPFTLSSLITSILSVLQPTFSQRLASLFNHYGSSAIKEMIACYKTTEDFAAGIDKVMEKIQLTAVFQPTTEGPNSDAQKLSHRRPNRMSMSLRPGPSRSSFSGLSTSKSLALGLDWDQELFQPFVDFQVDYGSLERRLLDDSLMEIVSSDKTSESDRGRQLRERSVDVFNVAEESMWRCVSFTHGYGSVGLVQALDNLFRSFIDIWTAEITHTRRSASLSRHAPPTSSGGELEDLDYTDEDWADFQLALHLLASARAVYERMNIVEAKLKASLLQVTMKMKSDQSNAPNLSRTSLLAQSTLNSAELHNLLNTVESDHSTQSRDVVQAPRRVHPLGHFGPTPALLVDARSAVFDFSKACQTTLQTTILSPLRKHLATYASSPQWTVPGDPKATRVVNDLQVPSFSLSPSDTVQRVAEGLLNLPRLFEVYADDDALAFSLHSLPYVDAEIFKGLAESSEGSSMHTHVRRTSLSAKPTTLSPEAVSSAWLSSLGHSILSHLTSNILPEIHTLTNFGAAQLSSDLGYLSNIVRALNVQFEELERWKEYVSLDEEEGKGKVGEKEEDLVFRMVARMRGWAV